MTTTDLELTARAIVAGGKGMLARRDTGNAHQALCRPSHRIDTGDAAG
jgi:hypothetical protein